MTTVRTITESQRKAAKVAGVAYLLTLATVIFAHYVISAHLIVSGNAAETARNIAAHGRLFRINIACDLVYGAGVVVLLTALYEILKPVNRGLALLATLWRLVHALIWIVSVLGLFAVLRLLSGADYLRVFEAERLQALAKLYLGASFDAYYVGLPFYALGSMLCSYLWFRSSYIPRAWAAWGVISSAWCAACAFAFVISPDFGKTVNLWSFDAPMGSFELVTSFWLLFKGLRLSGVVEPENASGRSQASGA